MANKRAAESSKKQLGDGGSRAVSPASSSSKISSPQDPLKNQIDFQFLNFSHPADAKASRARKTVRSHVTRRQHQNEHAAQAARRAQSYQGPSSETEPPPPLRDHAQTLATTRPTALELPAARVSAASSPEVSSASPSPQASPTHIPEPQVDTTKIYPKAWHPYIAHIMEHYQTNFVVDIPDLSGPMTAGLLRARFFPFIMTDPAPLHAMMLMAASHYSRVHGPRTHTIDLLQLRGMAISEINTALEDPRRAASDQVIVAVAEMACYECLFGDQNIFNTHMTGLLRLVNLRGGLPALGLDGLLECVLLWIDSNATQILGRPIYFDKAVFPTSAVHPRPDPRRFAGLPPQEQRN